MRLERMLGNGTMWKECADPSPFVQKAAALAGATEEEILSILRQGNEVKYSFDFWYAIIRDADMAEQRTAEKKIKMAAQQNQEVLCDCGHYALFPMNASLGTSCPDCYDKMSD